MANLPSGKVIGTTRAIVNKAILAEAESRTYKVICFKSLKVVRTLNLTWGKKRAAESAKMIDNSVP